MRKLGLFLILSFVLLSIYSFTTDRSNNFVNEVHWLTWEQAMEKSKVEKKRYIVDLPNGLKAEVDIYKDWDFVTVEVEFDTPGEAELFEAPWWFGTDVTYDPEYKNINLAK